MDKFVKLATLTSLMLLVAGCGGGDSSSAAVSPPPPPPAPSPTPPPPPGPPSVITTVLPATANPAVTTSFEPHVAVNPSASVAAANKLFVFLPGTGSIPSIYEEILKSGAARGFHALGINYPNPTPVGTICDANAADTNCFWDVRREIIQGTNTSADVTVSGPDSIVTRLSNALAYLQQNFPDQGWGQYVVNGTPDWSKIIVGGHSQGGGHAGVMAKLYSLHRACYFDSPADWSLLLDAPAPWTAYANVTPASRQFGFTHLDDTLVPYSHLSVIWNAMGLGAFGSAVSVDSNAAPFASSHVLTTQATPATGNGALGNHSATVADAVTPTANGAPVFDPVWGYLCFQ